MPEIWLNYGQNEVVLDIQQENLNEKLPDENQTLDESKVCLLYTSPSPRDRG